MNYQESKADPANRKRPLLKSMMLPESPAYVNSPKARPVRMGNGEGTPMRKSTMATPSTDVQGQPGSPHPLNFSHSNYFHPPGAPMTPKDPRMIHQDQNNLSYTLKGLVSPNKIEPRSEAMPEERPRRDSSRIAPGPQVDMVANQIMEQIREQHLPALMVKIKRQFYDELHQLRMELQSFKEQTRNQFKKHQKSINQLLYMTPSTPGKVSKDNSNLVELEKFYFLLEAKIASIESKTGENRVKLQQQLDNMTNRLNVELKRGWSSGPLRSSFPAIDVEHRQILAPQGQGGGVVVASELYHLDREGYLLDKNSYYLVDQRGSKIRLGERQLQLLVAHGLLPKGV